MQSDTDRLTEALKCIKNLAMSNQKSENIEQLQSALWRINNLASNSLNLPYEEYAKLD